MKAIRQFEDWELMSANSFPTLYRDVGEVKFDNNSFRIGRSEQDLSLYIFTDLPHPDNPKRKATYRLNCGVFIERLADHIKDEEPSNDTPTD